MATRNIVATQILCPICGKLYVHGFELNVGPFVRANIDIGDVLPWEKEPPKGRWNSVGVGQCHECGGYIEVACCFEGLRLVSVKPKILK